MPPSLATPAYRFLVATAGLRRSRVGERVWDRAWRAACDRWSGPVSMRMHGRPVRVNFGYAYPVFARQYPHYNEPLVRLTTAVAQHLGRPVNLVDVGAAVGDTVLLLLDRCPAAVGRVLAIDGDDEFVEYLRHNVGDRDDVEILHQLLSGAGRQARSLVRTHRGTASGQGTSVEVAVPLDEVIARSSLGDAPIDVIKVDTDGYDGQVLDGVRDRLRRDAPAVLFEWHPLLAERTGNAPMLPFDVLRDSGYDNYRWFDKRGVAQATPMAAELVRLADRSIGQPELDLHWDVAATRSDGRIRLDHWAAG